MISQFTITHSALGRNFIPIAICLVRAWVSKRYFWAGGSELGAGRPVKGTCRRQTACETGFREGAPYRSQLPKGCTVPEPASERVHPTGASRGAPYRSQLPRTLNCAYLFWRHSLREVAEQGCPPQTPPREVLNLDPPLRSREKKRTQGGY